VNITVLHMFVCRKFTMDTARAVNIWFQASRYRACVRAAEAAAAG
jgi:hypothetical protein